MADQRQIVRLSRADLEGRHADLGQEIRRPSAEGGGEIDHPQAFGVVAQRHLVIRRQGAAGHHFPDRDIGIGREDLLGLIRHFIVQEMRLMLDAFAARQMGKAHHFLRNLQAATVVDSDLGDHKRRVGGADLAVGDLHELSLFWPVPFIYRRRAGGCNA